MNTSSNPSSFPDPGRPGRWRVARRLLLAGAAVATLIAVFYTVENWRGKRAWDKCRRQLEARGEVLDWAAYIPAPVPDDQNFYKAPKMQEWFVKERFAIGNSGPGTAPRPFVPAPRKDTNLVLAEVQVVTPKARPDSRADAVLRFEDPAAREQAAKLVQEALGPCSYGAKSCLLVARPLDQHKPLDLALQADTVPALKELSALFPGNLLAALLPGADINRIRVEPAGSNAFRVTAIAPVYGAADYLAWTEPQTPDFDLLRKALERPYARIDGDYQQPFGISIPNFIRIREVAQILTQRAQCYLLLGHPEAAWHELALVHDLCQILEAKPSGKPLTLVGAMIHTAVAGLYTGIVKDGLRLHAWREPQLLAIERQLQETDLLTQVAEALREERAATCRTVETTKRSELAAMINLGPSRRTWEEKFHSALYTLALSCIPRGWFYQNMAFGSQVEQELLGSVEPANQLVRPHPTDKYYRALEAGHQHRSPYSFLAAIAIPNFRKALQTVAYNQTLVTQARLACALERYRLAQGHYPDTLDLLVPQCIAGLPHDVIGGQPLKYRRTDNGGYRLYSVGWNEKDDGGVPGKWREEGDWVWQ